MEKSEESGSPGWSASFFMQTTEDVAKAVAAAVATVHSPRPSVVYSSKVESGVQLQENLTGRDKLSLGNTFLGSKNMQPPKKEIPPQFSMLPLHSP